MKSYQNNSRIKFWKSIKQCLVIKKISNFDHPMTRWKEPNTGQPKKKTNRALTLIILEKHNGMVQNHEPKCARIAQAKLSKKLWQDLKIVVHHLIYQSKHIRTQQCNANRDISQQTPSYNWINIYTSNKCLVWTLLCKWKVKILI